LRLWIRCRRSRLRLRLWRRGRCRPALLWTRLAPRLLLSAVTTRSARALVVCRGGFETRPCNFHDLESCLLELDQRSEEILRVKKQHGLAVRPDPGLRRPENTRPFCDQTV